MTDKQDRLPFRVRKAEKVLYLRLKKRPRIKETAKGWRVEIVTEPGAERKTKPLEKNPRNFHPGNHGICCCFWYFLELIVLQLNRQPIVLGHGKRLTRAESENKGE